MRCLLLYTIFIKTAWPTLAHHHRRRWTMGMSMENTIIPCPRAALVNIPPLPTRTPLRLLFPPPPPLPLDLHPDAQAIIVKLHLLSLSTIIQRIPIMVLYHPPCRLLLEMKEMSLHHAPLRARICHLHIATVQLEAARVNEGEIIEGRSPLRQIHHLVNLYLSLHYLGFMIFHKNTHRVAILHPHLIHPVMLGLQVQTSNVNHNQRLCKLLFLIQLYNSLLPLLLHHLLLLHLKIVILKNQRKHSPLLYYKNINLLGVKFQLLLV